MLVRSTWPEPRVGGSPGRCCPEPGSLNPRAGGRLSASANGEPTVRGAPVCLVVPPGGDSMIRSYGTRAGCIA